MHDIWVEKYRPKTLDDVIGQKGVTKRLKAYVTKKNVPHMLFSGPAGTGKTTCAIALAKDLYGDVWKNNFHELNASDERGIKVVRTKIKEYARTAPLGEINFKIIFLDEADALTQDAQSALRRTMERYTTTCRFIMSCNWSSKIIEPIQSRCAVFRFRPLEKEHVKECLERIAKGEKLKVSDDGMEAIIYLSRGDMRKATNVLQMAATINTKIDEDTVYEGTASAKPDEVKQMLTLALQGDFMGARKVLDGLLIDSGLSGEDVVKQIHSTLFDMAIHDTMKIKLVDAVGEAEFRIVEGSNERIQIEALLAHFAAVGQKQG